jgi:hypothetical protein
MYSKLSKKTQYLQYHRTPYLYNLRSKFLKLKSFASYNIFYGQFKIEIVHVANSLYHLFLLLDFQEQSKKKMFFSHDYLRQKSNIQIFFFISSYLLGLQKIQ